jgi:SAM-dependent methyltransferase
MPPLEPDEPLRRCARGEIAPNVALMQLCLAAPDEAAARAALKAALSTGANGALRDLAVLWRETPDAFALVRAVAHGDSRRPGAPADGTHWRQVFDAAAAISPEASVALYSLGRPDLLADITAELVGWLDAEDLLGPDRAVFEIGCGIGRVLAALAPKVREAVGLDLSPAMVAEARRRCVAHSNIRIFEGSGRDLAPLGDGTFDLVLAVDVFPYIVAAGADLVDATIAEARRVLRPAGRLLVMNYSYRGNVEADAAELAGRGRAAGFRVRRSALRPFRLWDGIVFNLERL